MILRSSFCRFWLSAVVAGMLLVASAVAQQPAGPRPATPERPHPLGGTPGSPTDSRGAGQPGPGADLNPAGPNEHPLMPALRWAHSGVGAIEKLHDYSATLVKRERVNGKVGEPEYMFVKIRHKPFSVYIYFLAPKAFKGREVIYVEGRNNGKLLAHATGLQRRLGTLELAPDGFIAMRGNRYPLTEIGILNMVRRLVEVGEQDIKYGECEVKFFKGAKINDRVCTCIQVVHPVPRRNFLFHLARIFVDDALNMPIRYESYDWPEKPGGPPRLIEEYTYLNLKLNNGFTDADFDPRSYPGFPK